MYFKVLWKCEEEEEEDEEEEEEDNHAKLSMQLCTWHCSNYFTYMSSLIVLKLPDFISRFYYAHFIDRKPQHRELIPFSTNHTTNRVGTKHMEGKYYWKGENQVWIWSMNSLLDP